MKMTYNVISFEKGCDGEALDGLAWKFGADWNYQKKEMVYIGTPERFQELVRAIRTIETIKELRSYDDGKKIPNEE